MVGREGSRAGPEFKRHACGFGAPLRFRPRLPLLFRDEEARSLVCESINIS